MRLFANIYEPPADFGLLNSTTKPVERLTDVADVGIRWALPGGIQRFEVTVHSKSKMEAFHRYKWHLGYRLVVYDTYCDRPIADGQIFEIMPNGRVVTYICAGYWERTYDDLYTLADMSGITASTATSAVIKDILTDAVSIDDAEQGEIEASGVNIGGWTPDERVGTPAGDAITQLASMGNSSDEPMYFWFRLPTFDGTVPRRPLPVLRSDTLTGLAGKGTSVAADWIVPKEALTQDGMTISRHLFDLKTNVAIGYHRLSGTHTAIASSNIQLTDSTATFPASGVGVGDTVVNITDGSYGQVASISGDTQLLVTDLIGGTDNDFDLNDRYAIIMKNPQWTATATQANNRYWARMYREIRPEFDATQAAQYRDTLMAVYGRPVLQQAFVLSGPFIYGSGGGKFPLWRVIAENGGIMRLRDFYPDQELFNFSLDRERTFRIVAMDYTYSDNRLRVVPDSRDARLDILLAQALKTQRRLGQIISTANAARSTGDRGQDLIGGSGPGGGPGNIPEGYVQGPWNIRQYREWLNNQTPGGPGGSWG